MLDASAKDFKALPNVAVAIGASVGGALCATGAGLRNLLSTLPLCSLYPQVRELVHAQILRMSETDMHKFAHVWIKALLRIVS
jgi:hypothetical protein